MGLSVFLPLALQLLGAVTTVVAAASPPGQAANWPFDVTEISAPDGSITAKFVSVGAAMTELWVKDKRGEKRDVVLGYDDNVRIRVPCQMMMEEELFVDLFGIDEVLDGSGPSGV
jgi:hypothetical protein